MAQQTCEQGVEREPQQRYQGLLKWHGHNMSNKVQKNQVGFASTQRRRGKSAEKDYEIETPWETKTEMAQPNGG